MKPHDYDSPNDAQCLHVDRARRSLLCALLGAPLVALACRPRAADCPPYDPAAAKRTFDGRVGRIVFSNRARRAVTVSVYHPDGDSAAPEETWRVEAGATRELGGGFGNDWGVRVDSGCVPTVGSVAEWDRSTFRLAWDGAGFVRP
jgi:hypothetical protein